MKNYSIALLIFGEPGSMRNALTEEKYRKLAAYFIEKGFYVDSIIYNDSVADNLAKELLKYNAILVWVNPIEQQGDRKKLDALLMNISAQGCFVSAHPDTILKMGTKKILYEIRDAEFGGNTRLYHSFEEFKKQFLKDVQGIRILKQYRGNGGDGVYKIDATNLGSDKIAVTHAKNGNEEKHVTIDDFFSLFKSYFGEDGMLIDQEWNSNIINGMVRCYLSGTKVTGFGYQEINAFYPITGSGFKKPSQRFYFSEDCALFQDLKNVMEKSWISQLQKITGIESEMLPVIWDADFFINKINTYNASEKYSLCEINVSCVSPFPESAIPYIAEEVKEKNKALTDYSMGILTTEIKEFVKKQKLGFIATVCPDGTPNLSPKGTTTVWDEDHLVFADIHSPGTISNLLLNPVIEINIVDVYTRKGYRFKGSGKVLSEGSLFDEVVSFYRAAGSNYTIKNIVLIKVDRVLPITSPVYDSGLSEDDVKNKWIDYWTSIYSK